MKFIAKLKKTTKPYFLPMSAEVRVVQEYLKVDWINELVQQHEHEILLGFARFAQGSGCLPHRPDLHYVFIRLVSDIALQTRRFPVLQTALENTGMYIEAVREILFKLMMSKELVKESDYLAHSVEVICSRGKGHTVAELVMMIEASCIIYQRLLDSKAQS